MIDAWDPEEDTRPTTITVGKTAIKRCSSCVQEKVLDEFYASKTGKHGRTSSCKSCILAKRKIYAEANKQKRAEYRKAFRLTNLEAERDRDRRRRSDPQVHARRVEEMRTYYALHRDALKIQKRERYQQHRQVILANRDAKLDQEKCRLRYWSNPDREIARARSWQRSHPDRVRATRHRRRARLLSAFVENVYPSVVYERDRWICALCHGLVFKGQESLDHIVPLSRGGTHEYANVQTAHRRCNSRKGNRACHISNGNSDLVNP